MKKKINGLSIIVMSITMTMTMAMSLAFANEEAAGHHSEASLWDLKYPVVNFIILLLILSKVVKPMRELFNKNAKDIKFLVESSHKLNVEAEAKLKLVEDKIKNLDSEIKKIELEYQNDAKVFEKNLEIETTNAIHRANKDSDSKLKGEKEELIEKLNNEILNNVIKMSKDAIKGNKELAKDATNKIVAQIH